MIHDQLNANAQALTAELNWFADVLDLRLKLFEGKKTKVTLFPELPALDYAEEASCLGRLQRQYKMTATERLLLMLAMAPDLKPELLLPLANEGKLSPILSGIVLTSSNEILPTRQTAFFLLSNNNLSIRFQIGKLLQDNHFFFQHQILQFTNAPDTTDGSASVLRVHPEQLSYLTTGDTYRPTYSSRFPAKLLSTPFSWDDLILPTHLQSEIDDILLWTKYSSTLMYDWGLKGTIKNGYRALFHGKPGTGKTLTATLLGQKTNRPVYRVDLSVAVSPNIGETEKNLKNLFDQAEHKGWILFFDEADTLFGRHTESASDRPAHQQIAYLLRWLEDYHGLVILSSNLQEEMEGTITQDFDSIIHFPIPDANQRLRLWKNYLISPHYQLEQTIDLEELAEKYELTGGDITQILKFCCLRAIGRNRRTLLRVDFVEGIRRTYQKKGKGI